MKEVLKGFCNTKLGLGARTVRSTLKVCRCSLIQRQGYSYNGLRLRILWWGPVAENGSSMRSLNTKATSIGLNVNSVLPIGQAFSGRLLPTSFDDNA